MLLPATEGRTQRLRILRSLPSHPLPRALPADLVGPFPLCIIPATAAVPGVGHSYPPLVSCCTAASDFLLDCPAGAAVSDPFGKPSGA